MLEVTADPRTRKINSLALRGTPLNPALPLLLLLLSRPCARAPPPTWRPPAPKTRTTATCWCTAVSAAPIPTTPTSSLPARAATSPHLTQPPPLPLLLLDGCAAVRRMALKPDPRSQLSLQLDPCRSSARASQMTTGCLASQSRPSRPQVQRRQCFTLAWPAHGIPPCSFLELVVRQRGCSTPA